MTVWGVVEWIKGSIQRKRLGWTGGVVEVKRIVIDRDLFEKYPDFKRGVVVVTHVENMRENDRIAEILDQKIRSAASRKGLENEFVKVWDTVYRGFGSNPKKFLPSVKGLLKRIEKGAKPPFINSIVALFNYVSIKYLVPCGGDDIQKIVGNLHLGFAKGNEIFTPLGGQGIENPVPGEVIYYDDQTLNVMCRRWNWRNGEFSKITDKSRKIVINIDGAGIIPKSHIEEARGELANLLVENCRAELAVDLLDREKQVIDISL
jgi:DNA/RNA-binding domain of Phe-tRNA-synthetase-like protein